MRVRIDIGLDLDGIHTLRWEPCNSPHGVEIPRTTLDRWSAERPETGPDEDTLLYPRDEVRLATPLPDPASLRDFFSFSEIVRAGRAVGRQSPSPPSERPKTPVYRKCATHNLLGPEADVAWPSFAEKFDYELELAAVIGRRGRDIPATAAGQWIFGYAIMNDFTDRDLEEKEMKLGLGLARCKDWATAIGPWIVTADEITDVRKLTMTSRIDGELWTSATAGNMHWSFEQMIEHLSMDDEVIPGDVIASGPVAGSSGIEINRWVQPGELMELEIEQIGVLRNRVVRRQH